MDILGGTVRYAITLLALRTAFMLTIQHAPGAHLDNGIFLPEVSRGSDTAQEPPIHQPMLAQGLTGASAASPLHTAMIRHRDGVRSTGRPGSCGL